MKFFSAVAVATLALTAQAYPAMPYPGTYPQANNCLAPSVVSDLHVTRFDLSPVTLCPGQEQTLRIAGIYGGFNSKDKLVVSSQRSYLDNLVGGYQEVDVCQNGKCPTATLDGSFDFTIKFPLKADHWAKVNGLRTVFLFVSSLNREGRVGNQNTHFHIRATPSPSLILSVTSRDPSCASSVSFMAILADTDGSC